MSFDALISLQDIANYTRVVPQQREEIFKKFVQRINATEKVSWVHFK